MPLLIEEVKKSLEEMFAKAGDQGAESLQSADNIWKAATIDAERLAIAHSNKIAIDRSRREETERRLLAEA